MPNYDWSCNNCDNVWELFCSMSELEKVKPCPKCKSKKTEYAFLIPTRIGDPVHLGITRIDNGFNDVLKKIKAANYKSAIQTR